MRSLRLLLVLLLLLGTTTVFAHVFFRANLGRNLTGNYTEKYEDHSNDYDTGSGLYVSCQFLYNKISNFAIGTGISFQGRREIDVKDFDDKIEYCFMPVYVITQLAASKDTSTIPHINFLMGFNILTGNQNFEREGKANNGFYWGIGFDLEFNKKFFIELLYQTSNGSISDAYDEFDIDLQNSNVGISLGLRS